MPEISQDQLDLLQRSHNVLLKLNEAPETRPLLEKGLKHHFPQVVTEEEAAARLVTPQLDSFKKEVFEPLAAELKALKEDRAAARESQTTAELEASFARMRKERGFTDDGIEAVKKLMVDRSIADPDAAAARFAELNPPQSQEAPGWTPNSWNLTETASDVDVQGLFANEDKWADNMAAQTLNSIRVGQAA